MTSARARAASTIPLTYYRLPALAATRCCLLLPRSGAESYEFLSSTCAMEMVGQIERLRRGTPAPCTQYTPISSVGHRDLALDPSAFSFRDAFPISHHRRARSHSWVRVGRTCCRRGLPCGREHALPSDQRERRQGQSQSGHDGQIRRCAPFGCVLRQASEVISNEVSRFHVSISQISRAKVCTAAAGGRRRSLTAMPRTSNGMRREETTWAR